MNCDGVLFLYFIIRKKKVEFGKYDNSEVYEGYKSYFSTLINKNDLITN